MTRKTALLGAGALVAACAGTANAQTAVFDFEPGDPTLAGGDYSINNNGGQFERVQSSFNPSNNQLTFSVTFSNRVTSGFTLALNNGGNPKNTIGEMALFYFDANDLNAPRLTAYAYNGRNNASSFQDGNGDGVTGDQDRVLLNLSPTSLSAQNVGANKRVLSFSIDATSVLNHTPDFGPMPAGSDWTGAQFSDAMGIWMHPFQTFNAQYDDNTGDITSFSKGGEGWFDGTMLQTTIIPLPSAAAMAGVGIFGLGLRRRR